MKIINWSTAPHKICLHVFELILSYFVYIEYLEFTDKSNLLKF